MTSAGEVFRSYTPIFVSLFTVHFRLKPFFVIEILPSGAVSPGGCLGFTNLCVKSWSLSHVICVFLPGFQFLRSVTVSIHWANGMLVPCWMLESSKIPFTPGSVRLVAGKSSLTQLSPLNVLFSLVWVSDSSCKMGTNTDPQTLRHEELRSFNPERSLLHVSNIRGVSYHFRDLLKLSWILPWNFLEVLGLFHVFRIMGI